LATTLGLIFLNNDLICGDTYIVLTGNRELDSYYIFIPYNVWRAGAYIFLIYLVYINWLDVK